MGFRRPKGAGDFRMHVRLIRRALFVVAIFFITALLAYSADTPCIWTGVEKIIAIGDLHGDYNNFVQILKGTSLVDEELRWAAGKTHLVQTGDILDRGTEARKCLDLLMRLEKEAASVGGMVHVLLGNHEEMNITGISLNYPSYVPVEQFVSFIPEKFRKAREEDYIAHLPDDEKARAKAQGLDLSSDKVRSYWTNLIRNDNASKDAYIDGFNETYGNWLVQKNAVIKINDIIFCHGGISLKYSTWKIQDINSSLRGELKFFQGRRRIPHDLPRAFKPEMVYAQDSPLWYRGLAQMDQKSSEKEIEQILANLKARAMIVGHTVYQSGGSSPIVPDLNNISRFQGRVYIIDTGISSVYGGILSALIVEDDTVTLWEPRGEKVTQVPAEARPEDQSPPSPQDIEGFLKTAAILAVRKDTLAGRTAPWQIKLEDNGVTRRAVFKYIDRPRPDPIPDSCRYEIAAYKLSVYLGLSFVPPVVGREIEGLSGSLQLFVEDAIREREIREKHLRPPDAKTFDQDMDNLKVFENLVYESCTNEEDTLIRRADWKVFRVDFNQAFEPKNETVRGCEIQRCSRRLYGKLNGWNDAEVAALLSPYLNEEETRALMARKNLILWTIRHLVQTKGEGAVLF
jgi:hypothetical protein